MYRHDRFRPWRENVGDSRWIDVECGRIDVGEDRPRAKPHDRSRGRKKRVRRRDDLIPGFDPERHQSQQHGVGAGGHGNRVSDLQHRRELAFERVDLRSHDEPLAVGDARHRCEDFFAKRPVLRLKIEEGNLERHEQFIEPQRSQRPQRAEAHFFVCFVSFVVE